MYKNVTIYPCFCFLRSKNRLYFTIFIVAFLPSSLLMRSM